MVQQLQHSIHRLTVLLVLGLWASAQAFFVAASPSALPLRSSHSKWTCGSACSLQRGSGNLGIALQVRGGFNSGTRTGRPFKWLRKAKEEEHDPSFKARVQRAFKLPVNINGIEITPDVFAILVVYFVQVSMHSKQHVHVANKQYHRTGSISCCSSRYMTVAVYTVLETLFSLRC
jgi:hypothetical protein